MATDSIRGLPIATSREARPASNAGGPTLLERTNQPTRVLETDPLSRLTNSDACGESLLAKARQPRDSQLSGAASLPTSRTRIATHQQGSRHRPMPLQRLTGKQW